MKYNTASVTLRNIALHIYKKCTLRNSVQAQGYRLKILISMENLIFTLCILYPVITPPPPHFVYSTKGVEKNYES